VSDDAPGLATSRWYRRWDGVPGWLERRVARRRAGGRRRHAKPRGRIRRWATRIGAVLAAFLLVGVALVATSGGFLVVDYPEQADLIVVLAGEMDRRPARGIELLRQGYAPKMLLDVPANAKVFDLQTIDIAQRFVDTLPERRSISICPIPGLSTKVEARDVATCLRATPARRILLVTADYHTRRALNTFRHEVPEHEFFVAAATDSAQFGGAWWKHREWAKTNFDEWLKSVWWCAVDRWR